MNPLILIAIGATISFLLFDGTNNDNESSENGVGGGGGNSGGKPGSDVEKSDRRNGGVKNTVKVDKSLEPKTKEKHAEKSNEE